MQGTCSPNFKTNENAPTKYALGSKTEKQMKEIKWYFQK